ncbi:hypothetical protein [Anoxybacillus sp. ST4]|uniref:hypothetical protein n=1 Tax=Anoxybacillus sp. ST4 TaxID=2864181 RepID=UPI001C63D18B|nr:hypothetical protein [Anoxybacillus sp. ST4]MBW7652119.1 hypothetical protein [Anoxybacillus sp. ST4]
MFTNPFVMYLDKFNVLSPNHSKIYDEYTHEKDLEHSFEFTISTKVEEHLKNIFSANPHSVILTGNAGDGKTRMCRLIHDYFADQRLKSWPEEGIVSVPYEKGTIKIVKDLSELKEEIIYDILMELQKYVLGDHEEKTFFLIAANEGKLTKTLSKYKELESIREKIIARFEHHDNNDNRLSVLNLLDVTSSVYVGKVLDKWNDEENWRFCNKCEKKESCVIYFNHQRTSLSNVKQKIIDQYRLLDYLETHITLREMLIHISYVLTGGYVCRDIWEADYANGKERALKVYYQNFYGINVGEEAFSEMRALKVFKSLDPGLYSYSGIDDFIINGDIHGDSDIEEMHKKLFDNGLDMEFQYFRNMIEFYRNYGEGNQDFLEKWIPRLRRKLYFELENEKYFSTLRLLPFEYVTEYISMFGDKDAQSRMRKEIVNGLNRAFSRRLVEKSRGSSFQLKATNENLVIYGSFNRGQIRLYEELSRDDLDHIPSKFYLSIDESVKLKINLLVFEYLMRLNAGGMLNILSQDVEILLNTFKNELIQISETDESILEIYRLDREKGLYVEDELSI